MLSKGRLPYCAHPSTLKLKEMRLSAGVRSIQGATTLDPGNRMAPICPFKPKFQ
jgi:hypothetical protein